MHGVTDCYFKIERKLYGDLREELKSSWRVLGEKRVTLVKCIGFIHLVIVEGVNCSV